MERKRTGTTLLVHCAAVCPEAPRSRHTDSRSHLERKKMTPARLTPAVLRAGTVHRRSVRCYAAAWVRRLRPMASFWARESRILRSESAALLRHFLSL